MDSIEDLLKAKAGDIDLDSKVADIDIAKTELKRFIDSQLVTVEKVSEKTIALKAKSSAAASEMRMLQNIYLESVSKALKRPVQRLYIKTG